MWGVVVLRLVIKHGVLFRLFTINPLYSSIYMSKKQKEWLSLRTNASLSCRVTLVSIIFPHQSLIKIQHLPKTIRRLALSQQSDYLDSLDHLCSGLTHLTLGKGFNEPVVKLPSSLIHLVLGANFNRPFALVFGENDSPPSLTHITLDYFFNQPLTTGGPFGTTGGPFGKNLPLSLTHLFLGYHFNQPFLDPLPLGLTHLTLGHCYNKPFGKGVLPSTLTHLVLGEWYNQPFEDPLPPNLISLHFGVHFNHPLKNLPPTLSNLVLGYYFDHPLDFPHHAQTGPRISLTLSDHYKFSIDHLLPFVVIRRN